MVNAKKQKTPEECARWDAMRRHVVPTQLLRPINELEAAMGNLEPLLNPKARKPRSFVERSSAQREPEQTKQAFEEIIAKVERVCRHARKERWVTKDDYDTPVLQPMLDRLNQPITDEEKVRRRNDSRVNDIHWARYWRLERVQTTLGKYANEFATKVSVDTLWNAYRIDFRGKTTDGLSAHPFVRDYPKTSSLLRGMVRLDKMQRLLRVMNEGTRDEIIAACASFLKQLPADDDLRVGSFVNQCEVLAGTTLSHHDLIAMNDVAKSRHDERFSYARTHAAHILADEVEEQRHYYGTDGSSDARMQFKHDLLAAYGVDAKALRKGKTTTDDARASLTSAPHIEPLISYLRAEAALRSVQATLKKHGAAVNSIYPLNQQRGQGRGG